MQRHAIIVTTAVWRTMPAKLAFLSRAKFAVRARLARGSRFPARILKKRCLRGTRRSRKPLDDKVCRIIESWMNRERFTKLPVRWINSNRWSEWSLQYITALLSRIVGVAIALKRFASTCRKYFVSYHSSWSAGESLQFRLPTDFAIGKRASLKQPLFRTEQFFPNLEAVQPGKANWKTKITAGKTSYTPVYKRDQFI